MPTDERQVNNPIPTGSHDKPALLKRYGLKINGDDGDDGVISPDGFEIHDDEFQMNMLRLLNESYVYAADALIYAAKNYNNDYLTWHQDDQGDYTRAICDQISWITQTFSEDDGEKIAELTLTMINATRDELEAQSDGGYPALGFTYGYADHYSPLSELAMMNKDEED